MNEVEVARKLLVQQGMKPYRLGKMGKKKVEFISYPWQAGREVFVLVRVPNDPTSVECVGADQVKVAGQS